MRIPLEVGRAGLNLVLFVFVLSALALFFTKPEPGTGGFVITVFMLVSTGVVGALLFVYLKLSQRSANQRSLDVEESELR